MAIFLRGVVVAALIGLCGTAARAEVLDCRINQDAGNGNWLAPVVAVNRKAGADEALVNDGIIMHFRGQPVTASIATDNATRTTFAWKVKVQDGSGQSATLSYRLTVRKADLTASLTGQALGFMGPFTAQGRCTRAKG